MRKEEETLIKYVQGAGEINPDRLVYTIYDETLQNKIKDYLYDHPELKEKYFLGDSRLINVEAMKAVDREIVISWQRADNVKRLAKTGIFDNPNIKVKMLLDISNGDVINYSYIRESLGEYFDSIKEIDFAGRELIPINDCGWSIDDIYSFVSKYANIEYNTSRFYPHNDFQKIVESFPEFRNMLLFLQTEDSDFIVNVNNYGKLEHIKDNMPLALNYVGNRPTEEDYKKLQKFIKKDSEGKSFLIKLNSMQDEIPGDFVSNVMDKEANVSVDFGIPGREATRYTKYDLKDFVIIREKMAELISGIDPNLSDYEKFCEVYKRVCRNIVYDYPVAYPQTEEERNYSNNNMSGAQNLKNGLLYGKTVCAGYSVILRQALAELGIEAEYVVGDILDKPIPKKKYEAGRNKSKYDDKEVYEDDGEMVTLSESHAWVKVKIDGVWYNCDPTWDTDRIMQGDEPKYCLVSDETISKDKNGRIYRANITGPECKHDYPKDKLRRSFDKNHIYIGKMRIVKPTAYARRFTRELKDETKELKRDVRNFFQRFKRKKTLLNEGTGEKKDENSTINAFDRYNVGPIHIKEEKLGKEKSDDYEDKEL